ncbi:Holliday junction branch migration protein RuvA [Candidatus Gottesmanbacteria bacterium]|nr:Holliday junction branch migration protein RuvA [Candidatus Gottesmanbacteria bacterium]
MIGSLKGQIAYYNSSYALVEVGGVGYKVTLAKDVLSNITKIGQNVQIFTFTYVREDILDLYGFQTPDDLGLFEKLITVSGIGPKTAMGIFSIGSRTDILEAILKADVDFFEKVPRLGRKNAQKIIIELKNKVGSTKDLDLSETDREKNIELLQALKTFGFTQKESIEAIKSIKDTDLTVSDKIKLALKYMGKQ